MREKLETAAEQGEHGSPVGGGKPPESPHICGGFRESLGKSGLVKRDFTVRLNADS